MVEIKKKVVFLAAERDITTLVLFLLNIFGLLYLSAVKVEAGIFYLNIAFIFSTIFFFIFWLFPKAIESFEFIKKTTKEGSILFVMGLIPPLIFGLFGLATSKIMNPQFLFSQKLYQAYALQQSAFWSFYITAFTAAIQEELVFGAASTLVGIVVSYFIFEKMWGITTNMNPKHKYYFYVATGSIFSIVFFTLFHIFNPTYTLGDFIAAAIFRAVMNFIMFAWGGISFTIGWHMMNNLLTLPREVIVQALISVPGVILLLFLGSIIYFLIINWRDIDEVIGLGQKW